MIEYAIEKLTELLIKEDFEEKKNKQNIYIKKTSAYKDLIKLLKKIQNEG